jgi:hypothetical protein
MKSERKVVQVEKSAPELALRLVDAFAALRADGAAKSRQELGKSLEPLHSTFAETPLETPPLLVAGL